MKAKKSLGQCFLFDPSILKRIVEIANLTKEDTVIEIGAGYGNLTVLLAQAAKRVIAIEYDKELTNILHEKLGYYENIEIVHCDALRFPYESLNVFKVVANIPYYITTPILFKLLEARKNIKTITITLQKEVAERIVAQPGNKNYGLLSIKMQYYSKPDIKFIIPAGAFRPVPKVDSAVVHIDILVKPKVYVFDEELFFKVIRVSFFRRRKTILNNLKNLEPDIKEILSVLGIDPGIRAEKLALEDFSKISNALYLYKKETL